MGLHKLKVYEAECDECNVEITYHTILKKGLPDGWGWHEIKRARPVYYQKLYRKFLLCDKCIIKAPDNLVKCHDDTI